MLVIGDLSGIQDFLFDVRETGGKQAATLRFRSLRLQLIAECVARRLLWRLGLSEEENLLFCAAGKFAIDIGGANPQPLDALRLEVETWLLAETHGRLRLAITASDATGTAAQCYEAANIALQRRKLSPYAGKSLVLPAAFDVTAESQRDELLERKSRGRSQIILSDDISNADATIAGVGIRFAGQSAPSAGQNCSVIRMDRAARHTPKDTAGALIEFVDLASRSAAPPCSASSRQTRIGSGNAIRKRLGSFATFEPLKTFSEKLEAFFGHELNKMMSAPGAAFSSIYTVFAGGDDLLLVGPWDIIVDFADHMRETFVRQFNSEGLTISAGCAIIKPKFPIRLAAQQAADLLERAKSGTKDQFALLGDCWKWSDHREIIGAGKLLADWVATREIERGWLGTLLDLALLQRSQVGPRDRRLIPAMASLRLAYHVARNWPKDGPVRRWINTVMKDFDRFPNTIDPINLHLPAIIRYAMLATRSVSDKE